MDQGDGLEQPLAAPEMIGSKVAQCHMPTPRPAPGVPSTEPGDQFSNGRSDDGTLQWHVITRPDGSRKVDAVYWGGSDWQVAIREQVAGGWSGMIELFLSAFVTLFVVIDPPGCAPIYAGLTTGANPAQKRAMALKACVIAGLILLVFALFGEQLLGALHIELDSFRVAGGIMLFLIALDMVFEKRTRRREDRAEKIRETPEVEDVSVFPMAMPMLAGPGAIASIMLLTGSAEGSRGRSSCLPRCSLSSC